MKPDFALDFRNDAISLLHRNGSSWQLVGAVPVDAPDLPEALQYLRSTALGLSPKGLTTKLIIPDDQILYTAVYAPGPSEAERLAQVTAALVGRTPYEVSELAFDYWGDGPEVMVAVIAKETLAEAEGFATEHRFNPASFVAAPDRADFAAEPWFGLSQTAAGLLPAGEAVERDHQLVVITARQILPEPEPVPEVLPEPEVAFEDPEPAVVVEEPAVEAKAPVEADPEDLVSDPEPIEKVLAEAEATPDPVEPALQPQGMYVEPEEQDEAEPAPTDEAPVTFRSVYEAHIAEEPDDFAEESADEEFADRDLATRLGETLSQPIEQPLRAEPKPANYAPLAEVEEAPMALDVMPDDGFDEEPQGAGVIKAALSARVTDVSIDDDLPPAPSDAALMAFSSRRQDETGARKEPTLGAASVDGATRMAAPAKPLAAAPSPVAKTASVGKSALRGMSALVGSAAAAAKRPKVPPIASARADATQPRITPAAPARKPIAKGPGGFAVREPVRGKPRYLGLVMTVVLLFLLAMIAAWSSYSLGAFNTTTEDPVQVVAADPAPVEDGAALPDANDEMLADGLDPEALTDPAEPQTPTPETTVAALEPAPAASGAATPATVLAASPSDAVQDEIVLASMDAPPAAPNPAALSLPEARGDPLPVAQTDPPPFGTVYQFEASGKIVPTPEGIITPEGVLLRAGRPPLVPAPRPAAVAAAAALVAPAATAVAVVPETPAEVFADPALAGKKPLPRPATLAPAAEQGALAPEAGSRVASLLPQPRPQTILAAGDAARQATAAATLSAAPDAQAQPEEQPQVQGGSKLAVAISRKPAARPRDMSRAVNAAIAAAMKQPAPTPEADPAPEETAAAEPSRAELAAAKAAAKAEAKAAAKAAEKAAIAAKPAEPEDDGEPEVAPTKNKTPLKTAVAKQATFRNAINLGKTNLIGVYGTKSKRYALVRLASGRFKKVRIGDSVDGGRVAAITNNELRYQKGGRLIVLAMPKG